MRAVQSLTGRGTDRTLHACGASRRNVSPGTWDREAGSARPQTDRRAALQRRGTDGQRAARTSVGRGTDGQAHASRKAVRCTHDRPTWDGRAAQSAGCTWVTGTLLPALKSAIPNAAGTCTWFVGRSHGNVYGSANWTAKSPGHGRGMGGPWAHVGNVYRKANWTAKVQAGMCTRVARGVSVTLFLPD